MFSTFSPENSPGISPVTDLNSTLNPDGAPGDLLAARTAHRARPGRRAPRASDTSRLQAGDRRWARSCFGPRACACQRSLHRSAAANTHTMPTSCVCGGRTTPRLGSMDVRGPGLASARPATAEPGPSSMGRRHGRVLRDRVAKHTGLSLPMHAALPGPSRRGAIQHPRASMAHGRTTQHGSIAPRHGHRRPRDPQSLRAHGARRQPPRAPVCAPDTSADHDRIKNSQP